MATFLQTEPQLHLSQIEEIEKYVNLSFPEEYKNHMLQYNGGQCLPNVFKFSENGDWTESSVDWFLAIYDGEYDNLKNEINMVKMSEKRMPKHMLPIAHDPGGNLICISCSTNDKGFVYFWDHENEVDYSISSDEDYSNLFFVAKSFNEFVNSLK